MPAKMVSLRVGEEMLGRIDAARGDESRTAWMVRALETALGDSASVLDTAPGVPGSPRASGPVRVGDTPSQVHEWMWQRQQRLNKMRGDSSA